MSVEDEEKAHMVNRDGPAKQVTKATKAREGRDKT